MKTCDIHQFTPTELLIYDYIIEHFNAIGSTSIRELSHKINVSSTSILRCIKKMGYESFLELKFEAKKENVKKENNKIFDTTEVARDFFSRPLFDEYGPLFERAIGLINKSDIILFLGVGTSGILAEYGARQFSNFGKRTFYNKDPFFPFQTILNTYKTTVVIALSVSGETSEVIRQVINLKKRDCKIISITDNSYSSIAKLSHINFSYHIAQEQIDDHLNITTQVPVIFIIESLAKKLYRPNQDTSATDGRI